MSSLWQYISLLYTCHANFRVTHPRSRKVTSKSALTRVIVKKYSGTFFVRHGICVLVGGGSLVVSQEQDVRGGQFSSSESYVGQIHGLNVWNYTLSSSEIQQLASSCGYLGNVMAWPDLLSGISGHVQQLNTSFCAGSVLTLIEFWISHASYTSY